MTTATLTAPRRRPFRRLLRTEALLLLRQPAAVAWSVLIPIAAGVALAAIPATRRHTDDLNGASYLETYIPILMMFALLITPVNLGAQLVASYREKGVLRRLATTPVPPSRLLGAQAVLYLGIGIVVDLILLAVGEAGGVRAPRSVAGFVLSLLVVGLALLAIGMLLAALARTQRVAAALAGAALFPLMFFAGLWVPRTTMSPTLRAISDATPLGAGVRGVQTSIEGHFPPALALVVPLLWAAVCGLLAVRTFRWE